MISMPRNAQFMSQLRGSALQQITCVIVGTDDLNTRPAGGGHRRGHGGCEDEARSETAHGVDEPVRTRDEPSYHTNGLRHCPLDHIDPVQNAFSIGDPAPLLPVEPDGMDFVKIGQSVVLLSQVDDSGQVGRISVHGVHRFQRDEFGCRRIVGGEKLLEVIQIVVALQAMSIFVTTDSRYHRRMIERVAIDQQIWIYHAEGL